MSDKHIIIVEDEEKIARILVDYLEQDGFNATVLPDGHDAVEIIETASLRW